MTCLFMSCLWIKHNPNDVAAIGNICHISPNFISYGKTRVNFIMKIIFCDACKQFIKCPTRRWNRRNNNFAFYDAYFYERIIFQLSVNRKGFWYSEGKAIAPFLNFCEHKVISFCIYNKDTPFCWIFQVPILDGACQLWFIQQLGCIRPCILLLLMAISKSKSP